VNPVKWGIFIAGIPMVVGSTLYLVSSEQCSIVIETNLSYFWGVDIVAEQKQTYIGHNLFVFVIFHCPNFLLLPVLHHCLASL